jgi:4-hydroxy-tetrahydrodipicolinate reductase
MAIRVFHYGLGPIGAAIVTQIAAREGFVVAGAVDIDPAKAGRDIGEVAGLDRRLRRRVAADAHAALKAARPDVVILCTRSSLALVMPQIEVVLGARVPIVTTTEELAYPVGRNRRHAARIDRLARRARVGVLATGVNPGFVMDTLPIMLTAVCERVDGVAARRIQDARIRRLPFQQKIGAGLDLETFRQKVEQGTVRHVGLAESIGMIASALGWRLDRITDDVAPKMADERVVGELLTVERGMVAGIIQDGAGYRGDRAVISLHMEAYVGAPSTYDAVEIDGSPPLSIRVEGGVHGDVATASIVVNSIPKVLNAAPGLQTMRDLPVPSFFRGQGPAKSPFRPI